MNAVGLRRVTRPLTKLTLAAPLLLLLLLGACEEELAPTITKFELNPSCDVITLHTAARLGEDGLPELDEFGEAIIDTLGTYLDMRYFARASGGNRLDDPTGTSGTLEYIWDFGDGKGANNRDSGVHRYFEPDIYTVRLTVKDKDGQTATVTEDVFVGAIGTTADVLSVDIESGKSTPFISNPNSGRLLTFDISDPANPALVDFDQLDRAGRDIDVEGGHAYVAMSAAGMAIYDLSTPDNPNRLTVLTIPNPSGSEGDDAVQGVDVEGNMAYMVLRNQLLMRADVTDPANPVVVLGDSVLWESTANLSVPSDVKVIGTTAVIANGFGILVADFADTQNPFMLGLGTLTPGNAQDLTNSGNTFLVADGKVGLELFDLSNPIFPLQTGWFGTEGEVTSVAVSGDYAYAADQLGGIHVLDISGGGNPLPVGYVNTPGAAIEIDVVGDFLYVANSGGIVIVDVSIPATPTIVGMTSSFSQGVSISVVGNYAYVVGTGTLAGWIGDLSGHLQTPCPASGLVAQYTWSWDFGDGSSPQLHSSEPHHIFPSSPSSYDVVLTVTEEQSGVARSDTLTIDIPEY